MSGDRAGTFRSHAITVVTGAAGGTAAILVSDALKASSGWFPTSFLKVVLVVILVAAVVVATWLLHPSPPWEVPDLIRARGALPASLLVLVGTWIGLYVLWRPPPLLDVLLENRRWAFEQVTGVGDVDDDGLPEVLAVATDGSAVLLELDEDGNVNHEVPSPEELPYSWVLGLGNTDGDPLPEVLGVEEEDDVGKTFDVDADANYSVPKVIGSDWAYEAVTVVPGVDEDQGAELLGINTDREEETDGVVLDQVLHLEPDGSLPRGQGFELSEDLDFVPVVGLGDIVGDARPEVLGVTGTDWFLVSLTSDGSVDVTPLCGSWDYEFLTSLNVFDEGLDVGVLAVSSEAVRIFRPESLLALRPPCA